MDRPAHLPNPGCERSQSLSGQAPHYPLAAEGSAFAGAGVGTQMTRREETAVAEAPPAIPEHELIRLIGGGSSGQVWLARNALGAYRAVKIVWKKAFPQGVAFTHEFTGVRKFEPVSRLHDGLMDILQVGVAEAAGYFYCVLELADD